MAEAVQISPTCDDQDIDRVMRGIRAKLRRNPTIAQENIDDITAILARIRGRLDAAASWSTPIPDVAPDHKDHNPLGGSPLDCSQLRLELEAALTAHRQFAQLNPRLPGLKNDAIQLTKRLMRRSLTWYTRPNRQFQGAVLRAFGEIIKALQSEADRLRELQNQNMLLEEQLKFLRAELVKAKHSQ